MSGTNNLPSKEIIKVQLHYAHPFQAYNSLLDSRGPGNVPDRTNRDYLQNGTAHLNFTGRSTLNRICLAAFIFSKNDKLRSEYPY